MSGNDISQLQALLAAKAGIYPEGLITGYFGPATKRAVQRFQEQNGLPSVGRVGPATRAKLAGLAGPAAPAPAPSPIPTPAAGALGGSVTRGLGRGANGSDVTLLQQLLAQDPSVYPEANISGYFGALTEAAVGRFQKKYGIAGPGDPGYGYVGPKTRAKVNELLGSGAVLPAPPAATGTSADEAAKIKALQDQLKALQDQLNTMQ
jgi:peptidoglycan hydrolase-like protein with peptidoglycan-binding domain